MVFVSEHDISLLRQPEDPSLPTTPPDAMDDPTVATAASPILSNASCSSSAPEIHTAFQISIASSVVTSPSLDSALSQSTSPPDNGSYDALTTAQPETDPSILDTLTEALRSKDRIYVLRLGELMEGLINERRCVVYTMDIFRLAVRAGALTRLVFVCPCTSGAARSASARICSESYSFIEIV